MTIKHMDRTISAEDLTTLYDIEIQTNEQTNEITHIKLTRKNFHDEVDGDPSYYDLLDYFYTKNEINERIKIHLMVVNDLNSLPQNGQENYLYLIPVESGNDNDNTIEFYRIYIWAEDNNGDYDYIEAGTTELDLEPVLSRLSNLETNKVDKVQNKQLSTEDYTTAEKNKLSGIKLEEIETIGNKINDISTYSNDTEAYPSAKAVASYAQPKGNYLTSHQDISGKVDKVSGKGLSTNDFTDSYKNELDNLSNNYQPISNKSQSISTDSQSTTKYPSVKAVEDYTSTIYATKTELNNAQIDSSNVDLTGYLSIADAEKSYIKKQNGTQFSLEYADMENEYDERYYENHERHISGDEGVLYGVNLEEGITYLGYTREHNSNYFTFKVDKSNESHSFNELCEIYYFKDIAIYTVSTDYFENDFNGDIYDFEDIENDSNFNYIGLLNYHEDVILGKNLANVAWSGDYNDLENKPTIPDISGKVDKVLGKGLSTNDFDDSYKNKLSDIENNANNYRHPTTFASSNAKGFYLFSTDKEGHVTDIEEVEGTDIPNHPHDFIVSKLSQEGGGHFLVEDNKDGTLNALDDSITYDINEDELSFTDGTGIIKLEEIETTGNKINDISTHSNDTDAYPSANAVANYALTSQDISEIMDFFEEQFISEITVGIEIIWDDSNNENQMRPSNLTVTLLRDNEFQDTIVLTEDENWSHLIPNLNDSYSYSWIISQPIGYVTSSYETNNNITTCVLK